MVGYTSVTQRAILRSVMYDAHDVGQVAEAGMGLAGAICHVVMCPLKCMCGGHDREYNVALVAL